MIGSNSSGRISRPLILAQGTATILPLIPLMALRPMGCSFPFESFSNQTSTVDPRRGLDCIEVLDPSKSRPSPKWADLILDICENSFFEI